LIIPRKSYLKQREYIEYKMKALIISITEGFDSRSEFEMVMKNGFDLDKTVESISLNNIASFKTKRKKGRKKSNP